MAKVHVKVNDTVYVRTGKDKAMVGKVLQVLPDSNRVVVEGVNIIHKHQKPSGAINTGGIIEREAPISASNVMLVCPKCQRPSKTGRRFNDEGEKVRYCKACGEELDIISSRKKA